MISGPHQTPFICQTESSCCPTARNLGPPLDANCSVAHARPLHLPAATGATALVPMPSTTTCRPTSPRRPRSTGATVPFVVRVETGTVNRGIYQSAVLHDPTTERRPRRSRRRKAWNRRLIAVEGFGCPGGWYIQGAAQGNISLAGFDFTLLNVKRLGEGYAMFANTLQHPSNNCNAVLASETAMMSKEHFIETLRRAGFTVSAGCSGGSYGSAQPADRFPGLFDGVLIACTFPDPLSIALSGLDGHLLTHYFVVTNTPASPTRRRSRSPATRACRPSIDAANQAGGPTRSPAASTSRATTSARVQRRRAGRRALRPGRRTRPVRGRRCTTPRRTSTASTRRPASRCGRSTTSACSTGWHALNAGGITRAVPRPERERRRLRPGRELRRRPHASAIPARSARAAGAACSSAATAGWRPSRSSTSRASTTRTAATTTSGSTSRCASACAQANGDTDNHVMWRGNPVPADTAWCMFIRLGGRLQGRHLAGDADAKRSSRTSPPRRWTAAGDRDRVHRGDRRP